MRGTHTVVRNYMNLILALFRPLFVYILKKKKKKVQALPTNTHTNIHTHTFTHTHTVTHTNITLRKQSFVSHGSKIAHADQNCSSILKPGSLHDLQVENTRPASGRSPHLLAGYHTWLPDTWESGESHKAARWHFSCTSTGQYDSNKKNFSLLKNMIQSIFEWRMLSGKIILLLKIYL